MKFISSLKTATLGALTDRLNGVGTNADPFDTLADELKIQERIRHQLILPIPSETEEERKRATYQDAGQFLARQDRWEELSADIRENDMARAVTPGGMSLAELLSFGARADVVMAAEDALRDGADPDLIGIREMEALLGEFEDDYAIALVVAQAHMDIGWAWRGTGWSEEVPVRNRNMFRAHFARAEQILDPYNGVELNAPALAAARCALLAAQPMPSARIADDYEDLIDLDPSNPRPMRAMGNHLLPRWFGDYETLELEARRTAARTGDLWGAGGYTWVYLDALSVDPQSTDLLDLDFFNDGMRDILSRRDDQHTANLFAAFSALLMAPERTPPEIGTRVTRIRAELHQNFDWILRDHLRELHPLQWAQAVVGPDMSTPLPPREALIRKGIVTARLLIAAQFEDEIRAGTTIKFSENGVHLHPSG